VVAFWWWEFRLSEVQHWTFAAYVFLILYAAMYFLLSTLLFPSDIAEYGGFEAYFMSRRGWFFGLLAATFLMDVVDTALKGASEFQALGPEYQVRLGVSLIACLAAMRIGSVKFQGALVVVALAYQVSFVARFYPTLF
jgi:hypothetical protein